MAPGILGFGWTTGPTLRWACCLWAMTCCCMCWRRSWAKLICVGNLESWLGGKLPAGCKFGSITGLLGICGGVSLSSITKEPILTKINKINTEKWQIEMPSHCQQHAVWLELKPFLFLYSDFIFHHLFLYLAYLQKLNMSDHKTKWPKGCDFWN